MEILSLDFFSALAAIVVIDLMLAGDNAIVIALAARNVPAELQKRAIAWGTIGAIVVRSLMTLIVVWLLQIPGLLFVGGAVLVWIAYKLLLPDESDAHAHDSTASVPPVSGAHAHHRRGRCGDGAGQRARRSRAPRTAAMCWWWPAFSSACPSSCGARACC
jgi:predicted tellurium resistance membrane protein TerC